MINIVKHPTVSPMQWLCSSLHKESKILKIILPEIKKKIIDCCTDSDTYLFFEKIFALPKAYLKVLDCKERKKNLSGMPTI